MVLTFEAWLELEQNLLIVFLFTKLMTDWSVWSNCWIQYSKIVFSKITLLKADTYLLLRNDNQIITVYNSDKKFTINHLLCVSMLPKHSYVHKQITVSVDKYI